MRDFGKYRLSEMPGGKTMNDDEHPRDRYAVVWYETRRWQCQNGEIQQKQ
jgi:hypothetical protein